MKSNYSKGLEYKFVGDGYYVAGIGRCKDVHIVIPETFRGEPVVGILDYAFIYNDDIVTVTMPKSLYYIGNKAFFGCQSLFGLYTLNNDLLSFGRLSTGECPKLSDFRLY